MIFILTTIGLVVLTVVVAGEEITFLLVTNGVETFGVYLQVAGTGLVSLCVTPPVVFTTELLVPTGTETTPCPPVVVFIFVMPLDVTTLDPVGPGPGLLCAVTTGTAVVGPLTPGVDASAPFFVDGHVIGDVI